MNDSTIVRRAVSIGAVGLGLPLWLLLSPIWLVVSLLADLVGRLWRLPTLRLCAFAAVYLAHEWIAIGAAAWLWLTGSFGRSPDLATYRSIQSWWAASLYRWAGRLLNIRLDLGDPTRLPAGRFIMLSRHASMVDAVIPALVVAAEGGRYIHYVIKRELRWDPALDLFGTRLGNHFVARGRDTDAEAAAIAGLAMDAKPESALVIFPEGTYATPHTRERVLQSLRRAGDAAALARAEALEVLLPPKPAGTLALLRGRPDAAVVIVGHVGLGGVARLRGLRRRLPLTDPVVVRWWIYDRDQLPTGEGAQAEWLAERWAELDRWVATSRPVRG